MPKTPDISVVMTTYNRPDLLAQTLDSMVAADTDDLNWELIVVDNDSSDETPDVLARYGDQLPLKICHETRRGYAKAKNHGLDQAGGELIVFTDDDVIVDTGWLCALWAASQRWPAAGVFGGRITPLLPDNLPAWLQEPAIHEQISYMFGYYNPEPEEGPTGKSPVGVNLAFRASAAAGQRLDERRGANGSDNYLQSAEIEFILQLIAAGQQIIFVPDARVRHVVRTSQLTLAKLNARSFRRGRNDAVRQASRYSKRRQVAGAPAGLWLTIAKLQLRSWSRMPLGTAARYSTEDKLAFKRGALYQLRQTHNGDSDSVG